MYHTSYIIHHTSYIRRVHRILAKGGNLWREARKIFFCHPLALKMLLFYIKSTTCPLLAHCSPNSRTIYYNVSYSSVLLFEVLSSLLRLLSFVVPCSPYLRINYYNVSLCIVLYYFLKS